MTTSASTSKLSLLSKARSDDDNEEAVVSEPDVDADSEVVVNDDDDDCDAEAQSHSLMIMVDDHGESSAQPPSCMNVLRGALSCPDQLTAMISNYSTAYNAVNVGIALPVLHYSLHSPDTGSKDGDISSSSSHYYAIARFLDDNTDQGLTAEQDSIVASSLLAGMIVGQLIGGVLGDLLGCRRAMLLVMILQIGGSLGSAFFVRTGTTQDSLFGDQELASSSSHTHTALEELARWRFILGIGAGGVYPLAAVMSAQNKIEDDASPVPQSTPKGGEILSTKRPNNCASVCREQEEWFEEDEDNFDQSSGNNDMTNGEFIPSSTIDNGYYAGNDPTSIKSVSAIPKSTTSTSSFQRLALTFSTQGLGFITVPLIAYPLLELDCNTDTLWRVLLGVGAIPGVVVLYLRLFSASNGYFECSNNEKNTVDALINDDSSIIVNNQSKTDSTTFDVPTTQDPSHAADIILNPINSDGQIMPSVLFSEVSSPERNNDEKDNELALVEHSYTSSDNIYHEDQKGSQHDASDNPPRFPPCNRRAPSLWESIRMEPNLGRKLVGTAGTWFLFDVLFYGNTLFEPLVIEAAFGSQASTEVNGYKLLQNTVRASLVISLIALPGYFVTVLIIGRRMSVCGSVRSSSSRFSSAAWFTYVQTPVFIQKQGFFIMFILYSMIGFCWTSLLSIQWLLLLFYSGTFFFANYGPNTTTFLMPSVTYSEECRSTLNGISAAAGKLGALVGARMFAPAADVWGVSVVMMCCGVVSLVAWVLTVISL